MKTQITILILILSLQINAQKVITKKEAIATALENNYGIKLATNNVKIAENNSRKIMSKPLPSITLNSGMNFDLNNSEYELQNGTSNKISNADTKIYNASIAANYILYAGNGRTYNYEASKETHNLSKLEAKETIENTYLRLFNVYYQIARLSENIKTIEEALSITKTRLTRAEYQYEYGQANKLEILNAKVDINNDSINLINTKQRYTNAKRDLNIILVNQQDVNYKVETEVEFNSLLNFDDLYNKAIANNIVLQQQEKNIEISNLLIKANKAKRFPTVGLSSSYGWNLSDNANTSQFSQVTNYGLKAGINLSWEIFDGGKLKTRIQNSEIGVENQKIAQQQQVDNLKSILKNTWDDYQNKLYILKTQKLNVQTAQNNFDRTNERFKLGQVNSIAFRQAQVNLLNTQTAVSNAKYDAKLIEIQLLQLSGQLLDMEF